MPLVEQELLILPEKMSTPKVLMGFILLDLQFPVSWGGGKNPPFCIGPLCGLIFLGPVEFGRGQLFKIFTGP
jgi:hypothetical protein